MRLFVLAMTLFLLNVSIIMVDTLGIYNVNIANQGTSSEWFDEVQNAKSKQFDPDISADVSTSFGFGDFISGFKNFVDLVFRIVFIGTTLELFGIDSTIATLFGFVGAIIYFLGLAQFISNRSTKGMQ